MAARFEERFAREALTWIGTPIRWGQSLKGAGTDCKGIVAGSLRAFGRPEADSLYGTLTGYRADRPVPSSVLVQGMTTLFDRADGIQPGRILLLTYAGRPAHLAIATFNGKAVHAPNSMRQAVRETSLKVLFHIFPLHSVWRVPRSPKC